MLRITELKLPLNHPEGAIKSAILARLGIAEADLITYKIFRRAHDARKRNDIHLIYTIDIETENEESILLRLKDDPKISLTPDLSLCSPSAQKS